MRKPIGNHRSVGLKKGLDVELVSDHDVSALIAAAGTPPNHKYEAIVVGKGNALVHKKLNARDKIAHALRAAVHRYQIDVATQNKPTTVQLKAKYSSIESKHTRKAAAERDDELGVQPARSI